MSLSMIVELLSASRREAELMIEAAHRDGASVRLLRWDHHACVGPIAQIDGAHEALTDQADWNAATWDMDPQMLEPLVVGIERLYDASKVGITVRAIWPGDDPQRVERVTIDRMLAIVRKGTIVTKTVYVVMHPEKSIDDLDLSTGPLRKALSAHRDRLII